MKKFVFVVFSTLFLFGEIEGIQNHPTSLVINRIESVPVQYPIRFAFLGDTRNSFTEGDHTGDSIFSIERQKIEELSPLFTMHAGDFVKRGYTNEYDNFVDSIDAFDVNLLTVRGNHELYADEGPNMYSGIFGSTDYYFDYGKYRFIVLADCQQNPNTDWQGMHYIDYLITQSQLDWLESLLQEADSLGLFVLVFAHVPPYLPGHDTTHCLGWSHYYPQPNYEMSHTVEFTNMLTNYRVFMALFGHQHFYYRLTYNNVAYLISGGGGAPLVYPPLSGPPNGGSFFHFVLLELEEDGVITGYVYRAGEDEPDWMYTFSLEYPDVTEDIKPKYEKLRLEILPTIVTSSEALRVEFQLSNRSSSSLELLDSEGRLIGLFHPSLAHTFISTKDLQSGVYFLRLSDRMNSLVKKFIVVDR